MRRFGEKAVLLIKALYPENSWARRSKPSQTEAGKLGYNIEFIALSRFLTLLAPALNLIGEQIELAAAAEGEAERLLRG